MSDLPASLVFCLWSLLPSSRTGLFAMRGFLGKVARKEEKRKTERCIEEQIIRVLKEAEGGRPVPEIGREDGVSEQTVYRFSSPGRLTLRVVKIGKSRWLNSTSTNLSSPVFDPDHCFP